MRGDEVVPNGTMTFVCRSPEGSKAALPEKLVEILRTLPSAEVGA